MGGLLTNSGDDFVTNVNQNKWYTFETNGASPYRAHYTSTVGLKTERTSNIQYTNDFLWAPVGDPYGFKMYNRYIYKNLGNDSVMCTSDISAGPIVMTQDVKDPLYNPANSVYELLATNSTTPGYFNVHPVVNKVGSGLQYYINNNTSTGAMTLSTTPTEWTFGLSEEMLQPYRDRAGYVGGLTTAGKTAYDNAEGEGLAKLMNQQTIVYDDANIVSYSAGYYRIHSQPNAGGLTTPRYASGYTHKIELTAGAESTPIPMHFYEQTEYDIDDPVFGDLDSRSPAVDFTETNATRGEVPITTADEDPASIFQFIGATTADVKLSTQGLYVVGNSTTNAAEMTATSGSATAFKVEDIGGATILIYTQSDPADVSTRNYINWDQTSKKYDLKYSVPTPVYNRWCMQPVQKSATAGASEMALRVRTHDDGNAIRYTTFYAPFDVLLTNATTDMAYIVPTDQLDDDLDADTQYSIRPKEIGTVNTGTYAGNNQFIPAGTPAIIRTKATSGYVTLALPTTTPSSRVSCVFTGEYLEQMLDQRSDYVFVFGRPSSGTFTEDASFSTNGLITVSAPASDRGVGFYKNANLNRESSRDAAEWTRNNKYVYGNKIYYRAEVNSAGGSALELAFEKADYIPVIFDEDELELQDDDNGNGATFGDGRIYDLQGRCVATQQEVLDGSWINNVAPGIYILNGKKIAVK